MGQIKVAKCPLEGLLLIQPTVHLDRRGTFCEVYSERDLREAGIERTFVQENQSFSRKGTLRGLHFQRNHSQAKIVRVANGRVFDVAVDLRSDSPTWGKWFGIELSSDNFLQLFIPEGFAHGFLALSETVTFIYKCTDFYYPEEADGIAWNDPDVGIDWPGVTGEYSGSARSAGYRMGDTELILSDKDQNAKRLRELAVFAERIDGTWIMK